MKLLTSVQLLESSRKIINQRTQMEAISNIRIELTSAKRAGINQSTIKLGVNM
jgi:hypothetical protein